jgi:hypothetical protein
MGLSQVWLLEKELVHLCAASRFRTCCIRAEANQQFQALVWFIWVSSMFCPENRSLLRRGKQPNNQRISSKVGLYRLLPWGCKWILWQPNCMFNGPCTAVCVVLCYSSNSVSMQTCVMLSCLSVCPGGQEVYLHMFLGCEGNKCFFKRTTSRSAHQVNPSEFHQLWTRFWWSWSTEIAAVVTMVSPGFGWFHMRCARFSPKEKPVQNRYTEDWARLAQMNANLASYTKPKVLQKHFRRAYRKQ